MKGLCTESNKTLKKEIKENSKKWKDIPFSWIEKINVVKMAVLSKQSIDLMWSLSNCPWYISQD